MKHYHVFVASSGDVNEQRQAVRVLRQLAQGLSELHKRITEQLRGLASNPFLLWAMTRTLVMTGANAPNNRGSLFAAPVDRYIFEQREQRKPAPRPTQYNYALVKKPVLAALALKMIDDGKVEVAEDQTLWQQVSKQLLELERQHYRALPLEPETFMPNDFAAASLLTEAVNNGVLIRDGGRLRLMHESVQECLGFQVCRRHPENIQSEQAIEMLGKARSIHFASYQILSSPFSRQIVRLMAVTAPNISRIAHRIAQLLFR